jgi:hypothetical protein
MSTSSPAPLFIVGASRSGTTMLRLILNRHPDFAIPAESHFLIPLLESLPLEGKLSSDQLQTALRTIYGCSRFQRGWRLSREDVARLGEQLAAPTLAELVHALFQHEIAGTGKRRWGDKTPEYAPYMLPLARLFPAARFIHIVRDGRDVSNSLRTRGWRGWTEYQRARYWSRTVLQASRDGGQLGEHRFLTVSYEELVTNTETVVGRICAFLAIPFVAEICRFYEDAQDHIASYEQQAAVHTKLARAPQPTDCQRWVHESNPLQVLLFEAVAGRALDHFKMPRAYGGPWRAMPALLCPVYYALGAAMSCMERAYYSSPAQFQLSLRRMPYFLRLKTLFTNC